MNFFLFILFLLILFIAIPAIRVARRINAFRRQMNDMASRARSAYASSGYSDDRRSRATGATSSPRRRKRIGADVGEYVEWEDVEVASQQTSERAAYTGVVEEQISDVEWEEVR